MSNEQEAEQRMLYLSPEVLIPNPDNPRLIFREEQLSILEKSIAEHDMRMLSKKLKQKPGLPWLLQRDSRTDIGSSMIAVTFSRHRRKKFF